MPGHVKLGKAGEPDPDPSEYLIVSMDMKREDQMKPYDSKKSWWVPDGQGGYIESILESDDGKVAKVVVKGYEVKNKFQKFFSQILRKIKFSYKSIESKIATYFKCFTFPSKDCLDQN